MIWQFAMKSAATNTNSSQLKIGVLALQGGFYEHKCVLEDLDVSVQEVRTLADLQQVQGLVIPGGESTVMSMFLTQFGLRDAIIERNQAGELPILGTCAGAILLAKEVKADQKVQTLGLIDLTIERNAYGTQIASFVERLEFAGQMVEAMFIRAPRFKELGEGVEVLAERDGEPVAVRNGNVLALAFHPELVAEIAVHEYWLKSSGF